MSIASEITRLQTSKADIKTQVNIDVDDINEGTDFIDEETLDDYADLIEDMQDAYKQYIPINSTSDTQIEAPKGGAIIGKTIKGNTLQDGTPTPSSPVEVNNVTGEQVVRVCGKNLFELYKTNTTISKNGIDVTRNNDGTITLNGTTTANTFIEILYAFQSVTTTQTNIAIPLENTKTYTLSINQLSGTTTTNDIRIAVQTNISDTQQVYASINNPNQITNSIGLYRGFLRISSGRTLTNLIVGIQLEQGTSVTTYEPYQGKDYEVNLGKNILKNNQLTTKTINGLTFERNLETNEIIVNGTATANSGVAIYSVQSNLPDEPLRQALLTGEYYLSGCPEGGSSTTYQFQLYGIKADGTSMAFEYGQGIKINNFVNESNFFNIGITIRQGVVCNNLTFKPMISKALTTYAPYFEPIELNKIGDYQDFIRKGTGKNLINVPKNTITTNGVTCSWNNNFVQISGTNTKTDANWILLSTANFDFPDFEIGETYTISALGKSNKCYVQINYNVRDTTTQKALVTMNGESKSFIVPEDFGSINFIFIGIYRTTGAINENWYLQLEKGLATSYEPYGYKDKWYIEKNVGKVVLNGSNTEDWLHKGTSGSNFCYSITTIQDYLFDKNIQGKSNYFSKVVYCYGWSDALSKGIGLYFYWTPNATTDRLLYMVCEQTSVNNLRTWLSSNNVIIYYPLATPSYTLIDNEELLNQLDRIMQLYEGQNNISVTGDLAATLDLNYIVKAENHL